MDWALTYNRKQILLALREGFEIRLRPDCKSSYVSKLPPSFHVSLIKFFLSLLFLQAPAPVGCYRYSVNYVNGCLELYYLCCTSLTVTVIFGFCVQIAKVFMILWVHIVHILLYT